MSQSKRPAVLVVLAAIAALEGLVLIAYSVYDVVQGIAQGTPGPEAVSNAPGLSVQILIFALFGAGLIVTAVGWWRIRPWARAPFLLAQLLALVVGFPLAQAAGSVERLAGYILIALAIVGVVLTLSPGVTRRVLPGSGD